MVACAILDRKEKIQEKKYTGRGLIKIIDYSVKKCDKPGAALALASIGIEYIATGEISQETLNRAVTIYALFHMLSEASQYPEIVKKLYGEIKNYEEYDKEYKDYERESERKKITLILTGRN